RPPAPSPALRPLPRRPLPFPYTTLFRPCLQILGLPLAEQVVRHDDPRLLDLAEPPLLMHQHRNGERLARADTVVEENRLLDHCVDRKSTRLNSSHVSISYAVFCAKKRDR